MTTDATTVLRVLVGYYDAHPNLTWMKRDRLAEGSGIARDQIGEVCSQLIAADLAAQTPSRFVQALMPQARDALVLKTKRLRPSIIAS